MLYTEADIEASMDKIETVNFHEVKSVLKLVLWHENVTSGIKWNN